MESSNSRNTRSRKKKTEGTILASDASGLSSNYCRKCQRMLSETHFHQATDALLDSNGKTSICKSCCDELYDSFYSTEGNMEKSIYRMCKTMNVVYSEDCIDRTRKHIETSIGKGRNIKSPYGIYLSKIMGKIDGNDLVDLTFDEPLNVSFGEINEEDIAEYDNLDIEDIQELKMKWGNRYELDDLMFLEKELSEWQSKHKHDTKAEETLLEDLCHKEWEIRKARDEGKSTASLVKEKQDLMKTASIDPAKANSLNSGKNKELFSEFIRDIEETEPAERFKDRKKFKDWDNIGWYMDNFFIRALKNFILQSKDFNITEKEKDSEQIEGTLFDYVEEELE